MTQGRLFYVVGPSGVGKDTLLAFARAQIGAKVLFAHRYITRPRSDGEDHVKLSRQEFQARSARGLFALQWASHGLSYGIGVEIDSWLASGANVVVNGSRAMVAEALRRYPRLCLIHVDAPPQVLAARLAARGRESEPEIAARLARKVAWHSPPGADFVEINNTGTIEAAGGTLINALLMQCGPRTLGSS